MKKKKKTEKKDTHLLRKNAKIWYFCTLFLFVYFMFAYFVLFLFLLLTGVRGVFLLRYRSLIFMVVSNIVYAVIVCRLLTLQPMHIATTVVLSPIFLCECSGPRKITALQRCSFRPKVNKPSINKVTQTKKTHYFKIKLKYRSLKKVTLT